MSIGTFAAAGSASAAAQAKFTGLANLGLRARILGASLLALPNYGLRTLVSFGSANNFRVFGYREDATVLISVQDDSNGSALSGSLNPSTTLDGGSWYALRLHLSAAGTYAARLYHHDGSDDGLPVGPERSMAFGALALTVGAITIGGTAWGFALDGLGIYNTTLGDTGAAAPRPASESGRLAYYTFEGPTVVDHDGGTALTLSNVTLGGGGTWDLTAPAAWRQAARYQRAARRAVREPRRGRLISMAGLPWPLATPPAPTRVLRPVEQLRPMWSPREEFA